VTFLEFIEEHKIRKTMVQEKRYGVDSRLIDELKIIQLKRRKRAMFQQLAFVSFNNVGGSEVMVTATFKQLTIDSTNIKDYRPPVQEMDRIDDTTLEIVINILLFIRIRFSSAASLAAFTTALGDLAEDDSSSSEESNASASTEESQTSISSTDETMLMFQGEN
jgi:hypothetical protein